MRKLIWTTGLLAVLSLALYVGFTVKVSVVNEAIVDAKAAYARGDYASAFRLFQTQADRGNANGQVGLGFLYENGDGVTQDYAEALRWYRKAADQGDAQGEVNLGAMFEHGKGIAQNYTEAMHWYRKAADQGSTEGENDLGVMYENGHGVPQDYTEAMRWYRKAADRGLAEAEANLGNLYAQGRGVSQDHAEALRWYRRAADKGLAQAIALLESEAAPTEPNPPPPAAPRYQPPTANVAPVVTQGPALHYCDPEHPYPGAPMCLADGSVVPSPRSIEFRELIVDADGLAKDNAYIEVTGIYQGVNEAGTLWPPGHRSLDINDDSMPLLTENSPRVVREFFYDCRRRVVAAQNNGQMVIGCRVRITGHMTLCVPKASPLFSAGSPCLTVEAVDFDH